ncbi:MAG: NADP-dependent oxidoreductase [Verrucomicrobia bacterium]|nr:NADP-dependent oxidoreductase [Verrucomicrobiota bacterium]MBV8640240.1 NADP-dependent oxidoreductase [Verrucomicrobiota bacterium]
MKVITINEPGPPDKFVEQKREIPRPSADEVLIRIRAGSFNPIDYKIRQGRYGYDFPAVLGHDAAGIIEEVGKNVNRLRAGDEVWAYVGGHASNGAYAEYVSLPHEFVTVKPRILSFEEAASVPVCGLTANQSIRLKARPTPNHSVFVAGGAGGLGSAAIQILQMIGVEKIVTTSGREASKRFIVDELHLSPQQVIHYPDKGLKELTQEAIAANGGALFDKTLDFVGGEMKRLCFELVDFDGDIVSTVAETDPFTVPVWHGKASPLFRKSASLHFHMLGAKGRFGAKGDWPSYTQQLHELAYLYEAQRLWPVGVRNIGDLCVETVRKGQEMLEAGGIQGKLIFSVP